MVKSGLHSRLFGQFLDEICDIDMSISAQLVGRPKSRLCEPGFRVQILFCDLDKSRGVSPFSTRSVEQGEGRRCCCYATGDEGHRGMCLSVG